MSFVTEFGILIIAISVVALLARSLGGKEVGEKIWPVIIIVVGLLFMYIMMFIVELFV